MIIHIKPQICPVIIETIDNGSESGPAGTESETTVGIKQKLTNKTKIYLISFKAFQ